jgi:hypothetical protein
VAYVAVSGDKVVGLGIYGWKVPLQMIQKAKEAAADQLRKEEEKANFLLQTEYSLKPVFIHEMCIARSYAGKGFFKFLKYYC